jgi:chloramphenicol 3-O phosphotransferase
LPVARALGHLFATLTEATFSAAVAMANGGFDVLVDTFFERADCLTTARRVLAGHTYHLVAVTCPLEVLEARERARGDRRPGLARDHNYRVLLNAGDALLLDTGRLSVEGCVDRVAALLDSTANLERTRP